MIGYRKDNKWKIYIHIVPKELTGYKSDKYYIGITSQSFKNRCRNGSGYVKNQHFYRAIKKYGWNNLQHEIISENLTKKEACSFEKTLIKALKSNQYEYGYNISSGGEGGNTGIHTSELQKHTASNTLKKLWSIPEYREKMIHNHTDEWKKRHSDFMKDKWKNKEYRISFSGKNSPMYGKCGKNSPTYGLRGSLSPTSKKVICINTLEVFCSISEASKHKGCSKDVISRGCNKHIDQRRCDKNGNMYTWRFYNEYLKENNLSDEEAKNSLFFIEEEK